MPVKEDKRTIMARAKEMKRISGKKKKRKQLKCLLKVIIILLQHFNFLSDKIVAWIDSIIEANAQASSVN